MTGRWTLALLLTTLAVASLALTSRAVDARQDGEPAPGQAAAVSAGVAASSLLGDAASGGYAPAPRAATPNDSLCLTCHGDSALATRFSDGEPLSLHVDARVVRDSAHGQLDCVTCHADRETCPDAPLPSSTLANYEARGVLVCLSCHRSAASGYADSVHGAPVLSGTGAGATCNDCHSSDGSGHSTSPVAGLRAAGAAAAVTESCGRCHVDDLASYRRTGHGQLVRFADNRRAATCTDCHGAHAVSAVDDPGEGLAPAGLAVVCQKCHEGADEQFAGEWLGHEASVSPSGVADYLHRGIVLLMAVGVCFGVTHVTLDFLRNSRRPGGWPK